MQLADTTLANYGATTTIGQTSLNHVSIASNSIKLKSGSVDLITMVDDVLTVGNDSNNKITVQPGSMQIGSVLQMVLPLIQMVMQHLTEQLLSLVEIFAGLTGSLDSDIDALQAGSSSMQTQVVLTGDGMDLKNAGW